MPSNYLQASADDAEDFSTLDDLIDFANEDIIGGSVDQISRQTWRSSTTENTHEGGAGLRFPSNSGGLDSVDQISHQTWRSSATEITHAGGAGLRFLSNPSGLDLQSKEQLPTLTTSLDSEGLCVPWDDFAELGPFSSLVDIATTDMLMGSDNDNLDIIHVNHDQRKSNFQSGSPNSVLESSSNAKASTTGRVEEEAGGASFNNKGGAAVRAVRSKRKRTEVCLWNTRVLASDEADSTISFPPLIQSCNSTSYYDRDAFVYDFEEEEEEEEEAEEEEEQEMTRAHDPCVKKKIKPHAAKAKSSTLARNHHQVKLSAKKASVHKIRLVQADISTNCGDDNDKSMRKCLHCGSQTTPQWRAGPMGPKTLCNACGVRYKSGRLLPEYRPAASPTFHEALHSNSHRRVLEMHMQKTLAAAAADSASRPSLLGGAHENATYGLGIHGHQDRAPPKSVHKQQQDSLARPPPHSPDHRLYEYRCGPSATVE